MRHVRRVACSPRERAPSLSSVLSGGAGLEPAAPDGDLRGRGREAEREERHRHAGDVHGLPDRDQVSPSAGSMRARGSLQPVTHLSARQTRGCSCGGPRAASRLRVEEIQRVRAAQGLPDPDLPVLRGPSSAREEGEWFRPPV